MQEIASLDKMLKILRVSG